LARATIILEYAEGNAPANGQIWFPQGVTEASGKANIRTNGRYDGAPLGRFKIVVTKLETDLSKLGLPPPESDPKYATWERKASTEEFPVVALVEKQYTEATTTPLEIEVKKGKGNTTTIDVGKPVRYLIQ
jgi:hypothetical protein